MTEEKFNKRFIDEKLKSDLLKINDKLSTIDMDISELFICNSSLYYVALTILADYECLKYKNDDMYKKYEHPNNILKMAKRIIKFNDMKENNKFIKCIYQSYTWTKKVEYVFEKNDNFITLSKANMQLLIKAFRYYLMETVKRFFPENLLISEWKSNLATYNKINHSNIFFTYFVKKLLKYYKIISAL